MGTIDLFVFSLNDIYRLLLVMFRTGALVMTVPAFGHISIPRILRVWFILILSFLIFPSYVAPDVVPPSTILLLVLMILSELAVGFLLGFIVIIIFSSVQFAGHVIGLQMGLAVANVIDPLSAGQISIIGEFYYLLSLLIFFLINGHHMVIEALVRSFELVPLGGAVFGMNIETFLIDLSFMVFIVGIKLAAPVIITLFILNTILGIVARTVPQMNVFIVGFPLAIAVGLALIAISFPFFYMVLNKTFNGLERDFAIIINLLRG